MTRRTDVEESQNEKFECQLHEVSRSIKLTASAASGGADIKPTILKALITIHTPQGKSAHDTKEDPHPRRKL